MFDFRTVFAAFRRRTTPATALECGIEALEMGRPQEALAWLARAEPSAAALNKRGVALMALGQNDEALATFCNAFLADERHAPALVNLGNLLLEDGASADAIDFYRAAIAYDDAYPLAHRNLGLALKRAGRRAEGVRALRLAARLEGRPAPRRA